MVARIDDGRTRYLAPSKAFPLVKGKCRVCGGDLGKRRTTCSPACVRRLRVSCFVNSQRWEVRRRDREVCTLCGCDTKRLRAIMAQVSDSARRHALRAMGFAGGYGAARHLWEMDHIVPVGNGGGVRLGMTADEILANLRTLCRPCHYARKKA